VSNLKKIPNCFVSKGFKRFINIFCLNLAYPLLGGCSSFLRAILHLIFVVMILINKYEPAINIDEAFVQYQHQYEELKKYSALLICQKLLLKLSS